MLGWIGDLAKIAALAWKYGPLIASLAQFIEQQEDLKAQRKAATEFERGFRVLTQTKDPSVLEAAIRAHCGVDGCMLP